MKNTLLSVTALVVMNGVQQLLIYPYLTRQMGAAAFGNILVVLGIIAIIAPALGQAVNNSRIVAQQKYECSNGDADTTILLFLIPGTAVGVWFCRSYFSSAEGLVLAALLLVFTALKNYSDVQYRLTLNYNRYFFYYLSISLGYVIGALTYNFIHSWVITLLIGEVCGFLFVTITGTIYRQPLHRTANFQRFFKDSLILFASYLLYIWRAEPGPRAAEIPDEQRNGYGVLCGITDWQNDRHAGWPAEQHRHQLSVQAGTPA